MIVPADESAARAQRHLLVACAVNDTGICLILTSNGKRARGSTLPIPT